MLELKNITKIYRSKKGPKTTALNDVSLKFENKGLIFVLGKSGSGKSTLLNILGGLDKYNNGEIIINGKSSKTFKQKDFDAYRNTYVGFVFQEFNILEEFSVKRNIALALQLQQKEVNDKNIENTLSMVGLQELGNRKPNELSGGQKQRVAIARALIKNPDIILADEPTGNLDSETSTQIFELLKNLSKEKLVIVVSHDVESAKKYADRIIEFKDGVVINDTKVVENFKNVNEFKLIKSKLPFKESFQIGLRSLNNKKIRLTFTIILTAAALFFLGMSDMIGSFNVDRSHAELMKDDDRDTIKFVYTNGYKYNFLPKEVSNSLENKFDEKIMPLLYLRQNEQMVYYRDLNINSDDQNNYRFGIVGYSELGIMEVDNAADIKDGLIGRIPNDYEEVVIPKVFADNIIQYGINETDINGLPQLIKPKSYDEILNDNIKISLGKYKTLKIVGIINTDLSKYESLKNMTQKESEKPESQRLVMDFITTFQTELNYVVTKKGFVNSLNLEESTLVSISSNLYIKYNGNTTMSRFNIINKDVTYFDGSKDVTKNTLADNEVIIGSNYLTSIDYDFYQSLEEYVSKYLNDYTTREELANRYIQNYVKNNNIIGSKMQIIEEDKNLVELTIVGVYNTISGKDTEENGLYVSRTHFTKYLETVGIGAYLMQTDNKTNLEKIFSNYKFDDANYGKGNYIVANTVFSNEINNLGGIYKVLSKVAFYTSLVFFFFATFLLTNFIVLSISHRKKEIGILRAIGARAKDVLSIFVWEGIIIGSVSLIIALIATLWVSGWLNEFVSANLLYGFISNNFKGLIFTIRQLGLLSLVVYLVVFIASLIPTIKISLMKPIDAILNK